MASIREILRKPQGKWVAAGLLVIGIAGAIYEAKGFVRTDPGATDIWVDMGTNPPSTFTVHLSTGMTIPIDAPSGAKKGYPAERCYWTKDGHVKSEPTYVVLNTRLGKPEPTFCPDCGRLVVAHNPLAEEGQRPPQTEEEYKQRHGD